MFFASRNLRNIVLRIIRIFGKEDKGKRYFSYKEFSRCDTQVKAQGHIHVRVSAAGGVP